LPLTEFADGAPLAWAIRGGSAVLAIRHVNSLGMRLDPNMERSAVAIWKRVVLPYHENTASSRIRAHWAAGKNFRLPWDVYSPNAMGSVLCTVVELFTGKLVSGHVLAGHALALEHEVLAEGRRGRPIPGLRSAVQSLHGGA
jgi:hypothetical protein